jgi:glycosyltransferase involved in cell wall biosynthesis
MKTIVVWGTCDLGKPRNRTLLRGLEENGAELIRCHRDVWAGIEDKSRLRGAFGAARLLLRWLLAYPGLLLRYLRLPRHDAVLVGYLGHLDVLLLRPLARLRRVPVVWDVFLSLHDTVVDDRRLLPPRHPLARLLRAWEWLACRAADRLVMDTRAQADFLAETYRVSGVEAVPVGAEPEAFLPVNRGVRSEDPVRVLFYGQLIPLHGVETLLQAARATRDEPFEWTLIGDGQESERVRRFLEENPLDHLRWVRWVPYGELAQWIGEADVCLGIFGTSGKAARVIPNKVYQVLSCGRPLVTRDSPAIRELLSGDEPGVWLVPPGDPEALAAALRRFREERSRLEAPLYGDLRPRIAPAAVGARLMQVFREVGRETAG